MEKTENPILLLTLPFLTPLIPSVGISSLKSYLQDRGYSVKCVDGMNNITLKKICYSYFEILQEYVPPENQGFYHNIALDVLLNHLMAFINNNDHPKYNDLLKELVYRNFYIRIDEIQCENLDKIIADFFNELETYITKLIEEIDPSILGLSIYKGTLASSIFAGRLIQKIKPDLKIILGGTIFSQELFPDTPNFNRFIEKESFFEKIFIGESEQLFHKYLKGELDNNKLTYTLDDVDNQLLNLDKISLPDFSDFDMDQYLVLPAFTSRGCVYKCSFCAETVYWKRYNKKSIDVIVNEFEELNRRYKKKAFILTDCLINPLINELSDSLIEKKLQFYWDVYIKVDNNMRDYEKVLKWRKAGYYRARLGIETGSERMLEIMDKRITLDQIKESIINLANAGIKTTTYWISGHPEETEEDFQETLLLLEELQDYIYEAECDPFRYFYKGQVNDEAWLKEGNVKHLYPEYATDMLLTQTYNKDTYPSREENYSRNFRFNEKCKSLGIPNPYSVGELIDAEERWKNLHKNAVPSLFEINNISSENIDFEDNVTMNIKAKSTVDDADFNF